MRINLKIKGVNNDSVRSSNASYSISNTNRSYHCYQQKIAQKNRFLPDNG